MRRLRKPKTQKEPTIALINIVFLMLVFFMVAGTLAAPLDKETSLIKTDDLEGTAPPDALVIAADGKMTLRGDQVADAAEMLARLTEEERTVVRLVPDRDVPAMELMAIASRLQAAGAGKVMIVTERSLQ